MGASLRLCSRPSGSIGAVPCAALQYHRIVKSLLVFSAGMALGLAIVPALNSSPVQQPAQSVAQFPDLGKGLRETPGCVGVQSFQAEGGKFVIAAWFENRRAMEAWYYSKMHQGAMKTFFPGMGGGKKPFAAFTDEKAPLLVIASVTPGSKPAGYGSHLAVSQIAIEGYTPIPGGVAFGGTFSPEKLVVPGMVRLPAGG